MVSVGFECNVASRYAARVVPRLRKSVPARSWRSTTSSCRFQTRLSAMACRAALPERGQSRLNRVPPKAARREVRDADTACTISAAPPVSSHGGDPASVQVHTRSQPMGVS